MIFEQNKTLSGLPASIRPRRFAHELGRGSERRANYIAVTFAGWGAVEPAIRSILEADTLDIGASFSAKTPTKTRPNPGLVMSIPAEPVDDQGDFDEQRDRLIAGIRTAQLLRRWLLDNQSLLQGWAKLGRYGYRKVAELLRIEGWRVNHKKVERLWSEEGLQQPQRHKKRKRLYHDGGSIIRLRPTHPSHVWSIDFVHDKLSNGRAYKMLTVLDEYTRQALAVEVRTRMTAGDVLEVLYGLFLRHGKPEHLRSDNGPEFTSEVFQTWLQRVGVEPIRIYPGSPWENGYNERFNGTLRREVLNAEWFATIGQAQVVINGWLRQYNHMRPHQALNMRPPLPKTLRRNGPVSGG